MPFGIPPEGSSEKGKEGRALAAERALGIVPTAHTCDNVLEIPNYWSLMLRAEARERDLSLDDLSPDEVSVCVCVFYM